MGVDPASLAAIAALGASAVGAGVQAYGSIQAAEASADAEKARKQQADLDANRSRRERIREIIVANATARAGANAQGASRGSGIEGGVAQVTGAGVRNLVGINQNQEIGARIFSANADYARAQGLSSIGAGISDVGSALFNVSGSPLFRTA